MRVTATLVLSLAILALVSNGDVRAQRPLRVGVSAGVTPVSHGKWDRGYTGGGHAQVALDWEGALGPLGLRADAFVHAFRRETFGGALSRRTTVPGFTGSIVAPLGTAWGVRPYVLGGLGAYLTEYGGGREWHVGMAAGGGLRFAAGGVDTFVEARVHRADASTPRLVPLSLGVRF